MVTFNNGAGAHYTETASAPGEGFGAKLPDGKPAGEVPWRAHLDELRDYAQLYLAANADLVRAKLRGAVVAAAVGAAAAIAGATALIVCVTLALRGLSGAVASLLGDRVWAGELIVGAGLLLVIAAVAKAYLSLHAKAAARRAKEAYARRRQAIRRV